MSIRDIIITVSFQINVYIDTHKLEHPAMSPGVSRSSRRCQRKKLLFWLALALSQQVWPCAISVPPLSIPQVARDGVIKIVLPFLLSIAIISWGMASPGGIEQVERWQMRYLSQVLGRLSLQSCLWCHIGFFFITNYVFISFYGSTLYIKYGQWSRSLMVCLHVLAPSSYILPPPQDNSFLCPDFK